MDDDLSLCVVCGDLTKGGKMCEDDLKVWEYIKQCMSLPTSSK